LYANSTGTRKWKKKKRRRNDGMEQQHQLLHGEGGKFFGLLPPWQRTLLLRPTHNDSILEEIFEVTDIVDHDNYDKSSSSSDDDDDGRSLFVREEWDVIEVEEESFHDDDREITNDSDNNNNNNNNNMANHDESNSPSNEKKEETELVVAVVDYVDEEIVDVVTTTPKEGNSHTKEADDSLLIPSMEYHHGKGEKAVIADADDSNGTEQIVHDYDRLLSASSSKIDVGEHVREQHHTTTMDTTTMDTTAATTVADTNGASSSVVFSGAAHDNFDDVDDDACETNIEKASHGSEGIIHILEEIGGQTLNEEHIVNDDVQGVGQNVDQDVDHASLANGFTREDMMLVAEEPSTEMIREDVLTENESEEHGIVLVVDQPTQIIHFEDGVHETTSSASQYIMEKVSSNNIATLVSPPDADDDDNNDDETPSLPQDVIDGESEVFVEDERLEISTIEYTTGASKETMDTPKGRTTTKTTTTAPLPPLPPLAPQLHVILQNLQDVSAFVTYASSILLVAYGMVAHAFLSFFHERYFFFERRNGRSSGDSGSNKRYWRPIAFRIAVAIAISGMRWGLLRLYRCCCGGGGGGGMMMMLEVLYAVASIVLSIKLLLRTHREEVDGRPSSSSPASSSSMTTTKTMLEGKVVLITGANAGIGLETARQLHQRGATVLMGCRSKARALEAMKDIEETVSTSSSSSSAAAASSRMHFIPLDLTNIASIHEAVRIFHGLDMPLHVLINNAGVMRKEREVTVDGLETTMAANHLGHFLLTNLLLLKLRDTAHREECPTRVITVSSSLYCTATRYVNGKIESGIDLNDLQCQNRRYALFEQYAQSKLANILFALELGRRERNRRGLPVAVATVPRGLPPCSALSPVVKRRVSSARKLLVPKLTPTTIEESEVDEDGLGFCDIVLSPSLAPGRGKKKMIRPESACIGGNKEEHEDDNNIKMGRNLSPSTPVENDIDSNGAGFVFDDTMPSRPPPCDKKKKKIRPKVSPVSINSNGAEEKKKGKDEKKKKFRPKLIPAERDNVEDGVGFDYITPSPSPGPASSDKKKKKKVQPNMGQTKREIFDNYGDAVIQDGTASENNSKRESFYPVQSYCLHPGLVRTNVVRDMPWYLFYPNKLFSIFLAILQKSPHAGAACSVFCAVMDSKEMYQDTCYFVNSELQPLDELALNKDDANQLWELSSKLVSIPMDNTNTSGNKL